MSKSTQSYQDVLDSEGARFLNRMKLYSYSYYCFHANFVELIESLEQSASLAFAFDIWRPGNGEKKKKAFHEIVRRFHNAVAAAKSLVEHTRIFAREHYQGNSVITLAYEQKVSEAFLSNGNAAVIEDLRNYFLHAGIPPVKFQMRYGTDIKHEVLLDQKALKAWGRLKSQSKEYLSHFENDIELLALVKEYGATVEAFHNWFASLLQDYHAKDLEHTYALEEALTNPGHVFSRE